MCYRAGVPNSPGTCSYCPYSPKCLEKLFGKEPKAFRTRVFGDKMQPIKPPSSPLGVTRRSDSATLPLFQTVSEGAFSEVRGHGVLRSSALL
jgi:hypothetical protein